MGTKRTLLIILSITAMLLSILRWRSVTATPSLTAHTGNILYVRPKAIGTCRDSWGNACDLQAALNVGGSGDEIWVAEGLYYTGPAGNYTATFQLKSGVALYGGFGGMETKRDQRDWENHLSVLSGDIDRNDITDPHGVITDTARIMGRNSYHVVTSIGVTETAVLDGFTITAGNADCIPCSGGGMINGNSSPTLSNITFSANSAFTMGGGMVNFSSSPTLTNVTFSHNSAPNGGGMDNESSSPILTSVTFSANSASQYGGGMYNSYSSPTLTNVTISDNSSSYSGGGMYNLESNPTLSNVTFSANFANYAGGGIYNRFGSPTLSKVTFSTNYAYEGGGIYNETSYPTLTNVTFYANTAFDYGGGIYNDTVNTTLTNVTFSANSAYRGGGIYNSISSPTLTNAILWGNTPDQILNSFDITATISYSDVQGGYPGVGNIGEDPEDNPLLGELADNGGLTWTQALRFGSPAIDSGDPKNCPSIDARGVTRPVDGNYDGQAVCDMGAYEYRFNLLFFPHLWK